MKIITTKVEKEISIFVSDDEKEFETKDECKNYEKELKRINKGKSFFYSILVKELNGFTPCDGNENYENHCWRWVRVKNQKDLNQLNDFLFFNEPWNLIKIDSFPELICIETDNEELSSVDLWESNFHWQTLSNCKNYVKNMFSSINTEVTFTEKIK